jgi:hypothetical protein
MRGVKASRSILPPTSPPVQDELRKAGEHELDSGCYADRPGHDSDGGTAHGTTMGLDTREVGEDGKVSRSVEECRGK